MISVSFFLMILFWRIEENAPGGGVLARFYGRFELFLPRGWGIRPSKKLPGGWSGLELTDT